MTLNSDFISLITGTLSDITDPAKLLDAITATDPVVSLRVNPRKPAVVPWEGAEPVAWCENGVYLPVRPLFTLAPELHQGRIYVQDASSMFIHLVIRQLCQSSAPLTYMDACAAPGGKTTAAIDALPAGSLVVANEFDPRRAGVLRENLVKWGYPDIIVTQGDTAAFRRIDGMFDIVAADVPCSGEGMMRKDPEAVSQWSPGLVDECVERQRQIVSNLMASLKPGGYFIYSTCTFNKEENERMVEWMADNYGMESVSVDLPEESGILVSRPRNGMECYRFMPHLVRGEGLFMAVMRKPGDITEHSSLNDNKKKKEKTRSNTRPDKITAQCEQWISEPHNYMLTVNNDLITAFPKHYLPQLDIIRRHCRVIQAGVAVATVKGKDLIPEHALAMSPLLSKDAFPGVELTLEDALTYLRRDSIKLPDNTDRGFVTVNYGGFPLGFVKNLGNRSNNLYPQGWRILRPA
ncbi:MAG: rRNA cytosine-C5-methyltransferase [Muribaculaceae bacterium]|nr:rRNA cytosine-C5-methyltransferase [Muribaculaceae bacterium]